MDITHNVDAGTLNIIMNGAFTFNDHPEFRGILQKIEDGEVQRVVLHMDGVNFVDSAALGMLLLLLDEAEKYRKSLVIRGATGQVKKMFDMARFNNLFTMN